jgi:hypothetical protein
MEMTGNAQVVNLLLKDLQGDDEEQPTTQDVQCRNVVAECLGHLALLHPPLATMLLTQAQNGNGIMRQYIVRAFKAMLVASPHPIDSYLAGMMPVLLAYLADEDRYSPMCSTGNTKEIMAQTTFTSHFALWTS